MRRAPERRLNRATLCHASPDFLAKMRTASHLFMTAPACRIGHSGTGENEAMTDVDHWLTHYGKSHANVSFPILYWMAVPALVVGTVGLLWSLSVPGAFTDISPVLNWGTTFLMAAVVYYFIISLSLAIGMFAVHIRSDRIRDMA